MILEAVSILWFFTGAFIANGTPVVVNRVPLIKNWNTPLDFGKKLDKKDIFGNNKTWRGLTSGVALSIITVFIQKMILRTLEFDVIINNLSFIDLPTVLFGGLLGFGALAGDAVESFIKRQLEIEPGKSWFPFDQVDYTLGAILFTLPIIMIQLYQYIILLAIGLLIHVLAAYIGYLLGLKKTPI